MSQSANTLKKLSFELGGNAPFIVFDDANLDLALQGTIASKFKVSGQTCVCSNRIFVQKGVYNEFVRKLKDAVGRFQLGSGFEGKVTHGPLVTPAAAERVDGLVDDAVKKGAKVEIGGKRRTDMGESTVSAIIALSHASILEPEHELTSVFTHIFRPQLLRADHPQQRKHRHAPRDRRDLWPRGTNLHL
jgi:succinate-semialdehyde dehydrogenase/glutarate-semialdehyde dehydrogenase